MVRGCLRIRFCAETDSDSSETGEAERRILGDMPSSDEPVAAEAGRFSAESGILRQPLRVETIYPSLSCPYPTTMKHTPSLIVLALAALLLLPQATLANNGDKNASVKGKIEIRDDVREMIKLFRNDVKTASVRIEGTATSISGATLLVQADGGLTYTVNAGSATVTRRKGGTMPVSDMQIGDRLEVRGTKIGLTIDAKKIRDLSQQRARLDGSISSVNAAAQNFVLMDTDRGTVTVSVTAQTKLTENGDVVAFGRLTAGQRVTVSGIWNTASKTVKAEEVRITSGWQVIVFDGTVTAKTDTLLTVTRTGDGTSFSVNASRAMVMSNFYAILSLGDLRVGDSVLVGGIHSLDSTSVTAFFIRDASLAARP